MAAGGIARADDAQKAKIGVLRLSSSAPVFIAQDKGYFREAGLDIELKFFDAAQPIAVATTSGDVDFGITAFTAGLYNLAGKGTLKVIGGMSREKAGYPLIGYFASNNAYAAGPEDAKGSRGQAHRGHAGRLQLSLFARPARRQIRLQARGRKSAAAAVAVECRGRAEGRNRRCRAAADLDRAGAGGFRRRQIPRLGRRRDAVAARRGVRLAEDADQQGAGDEAARRAGARRPRISRRDPGFREGRQGRRSTTRQSRCSRSSPNTPTCRWSRWSAIAPISIPTASST